MPFNQALFWVGLTAFGTGLYFLFEATVKRLYSIGMTVIGVLACAYTVYRDSHPESPAVHLWVILLVLTWAFLGYSIYVRGLRQLPPLPEKLKGQSKLVIHSANYKAIGGGGKAYNVTEFMRQIITGDSLVLDIQNHNFWFGDENFVPKDPCSGTVKRLQVTYSYDGGESHTIERT